VEAQAISNFLVTVFLPANPNRPSVLTHDMNEDVASPPSGTGHPFSSMVSGPTDLRTTTPVNPQTGSARTFSIQATGQFPRPRLTGRVREQEFYRDVEESD
jgi:hypothetical protein